MGRKRVRRQKPQDSGTDLDSMEYGDDAEQSTKDQDASSMNVSTTATSPNINVSNISTVSFENSTKNGSQQVQPQSTSGNEDHFPRQSTQDLPGSQNACETQTQVSGLSNSIISPIEKVLTANNNVNNSLVLSPSTITTFVPLNTSSPIMKAPNPIIDPTNSSAKSYFQLVNTESLNTPRHEFSPKTSDINYNLENMELEDPLRQFASPNTTTAANYHTNAVTAKQSQSDLNFTLYHSLVDSPIVMRVHMSDSESSDEENEEPHRYKLRSRNLFSQGVAVQRYDPFSATSEDDNEDNDNENDNDVYFYLNNDSDDDCGEIRKRSSYSGIRGPKADAKALSLVTNCPVSVKWLMDNFEYHPGKSLPRGFVYDQYVLLCDENGLEPVNAASFGKLIRSVFPGLKTRRLGTRGNSKYHYNGVYLQAQSPLKSILNLVRTQQGLTYDNNGRRGRRIRKCLEADAAKEIMGFTDGEEFADCSPDEYLGKMPDTTHPFAEMQVDAGTVPPSLEPNQVEMFQKMYSSHCHSLLRAFHSFSLNSVYDELKRFWRFKCNQPIDAEGVMNYKDCMSKATLFKICSLEAAQRFMMTMDLSTYQHIIDILYPCLSRGMPVTMVNSMRNFTKDVINIYTRMMDGYPKKMAQIKLRCLRTFVSMWNDYNRLNRMLRSAVSTIRSEDNIQAMKSELNRSINFKEIESEVALNEKPNSHFLMNDLILAFRSNLDNTTNYSVKSWISWAENIVVRLIAESNRQLSAGHVKKTLNPFSFWKSASDRIMGAMVKGNAVSFGVFKGFLIWCDNIIRHLTKIQLSRVEGFMMPIFYYESILEKNDEEHKFLENRITMAPISFAGASRNPPGWRPRLQNSRPSLLPQINSKVEKVSSTDENSLVNIINLPIPESGELANIEISHHDAANMEAEATMDPTTNPNIHIIQDPYSNQVFYFDSTEISHNDVQAFLQHGEHSNPVGMKLLSNQDQEEDTNMEVDETDANDPQSTNIVVVES